MSLPSPHFCHSEPLTSCHSERSEESHSAQGRLRQGSSYRSGHALRSNLKLGAIIAAAGDSQRMSGINKIFVSLEGKPLLAWSVDICHSHDSIRQIAIALKNTDLELGERLNKERGWSKVTLYPGGPRRQDSVREGLHRLVDCDWVMIHDGARPFLTHDLIQNGLEAAMETGAAISAVPVKDTIKVINGEGMIKETLQRHMLWTAQTPQFFRFDIISKAYEGLATEVTDDAAAVERLGYRVKLYMGSSDNIKITMPEDLALAKTIIQGGERGKWK